MDRVKRWLGIVGIALCLGGLYHGIDELQFSSYQWLENNNPIYQNKRYLDTEFEQGESLFLVIRLQQNYFNQALFNELDRIVGQIKQIDFVTEVNSPLHATTFIRDAQETLHNVSFKQAMERGLIDSKVYPEKLANSHYQGRLIDESGRIISIKLALGLDPDKNNDPIRVKVFERLKTIMSQSAHFKDYGFSGEAELYHRLDTMSKDNIRELLPWAAIGLLLMLALFFRHPIYVLITGTVTLMTLLLAFNINQWLNFSFNVLSASLPVLVITIAVADSIHIIKRWQDTIGLMPKKTVQTNPSPYLLTCWLHTWRPCFFTSLTSATGFGVFYFSELIPLSNFGLVAFIAILLAWPTIMVTTLLLLYIFRPTATQSTGMEGMALPVTDFIRRRDGQIILVTVGLFIAFLLSLPLAKTETNFLEVFFDPQSKTRQTFDLVDSALGGSGSVAIILRADAPDSFKELSLFEQIQRQIAAFDQINGLLSTSSLLQPIEMVHKPLGGEGLLPETENALAQELLFLEFSRDDINTDVLSEFVDFDYQNSRISLHTKNLKSSQTESFLSELKPTLNKVSSVDYLLTGNNVYFHRLSAYVLDSQISSILLTLLIIWMVFLVQFGFKLGTIATISSLTPITITLTLQILAGIPFDFSTVMVASVAMGLAIDATIHYLHRFNFHQASAERLQAATRDTQQPIIITTVILVAGFLLLTQSELQVIDRFSQLLSLALFLSLPATFLLLPGLLNRFVIQKRTAHRKS